MTLESNLPSKIIFFCFACLSMNIKPKLSSEWMEPEIRISQCTKLNLKQAIELHLVARALNVPRIHKLGQFNTKQPLINITRQYRPHPHPYSTYSGGPPWTWSPTMYLSPSWTIDLVSPWTMDLPPRPWAWLPLVPYTWSPPGPFTCTQTMDPPSSMTLDLPPPLWTESHTRMKTLTVLVLQRWSAKNLWWRLCRLFYLLAG